MPDTVTCFVSGGHTVYIGPWTGFGGGPVRHGPGDVVSLPPDEARRLTALGFVQDTPPTIAPRAQAPNPGRVGAAGPTQGVDYQR
jgi:hypothetical protein